MRARIGQQLADVSLLAVWHAAGEQLLAGRARWALWAPVLMGLGIGIYFALPWEPMRFAGAAALVLTIAGVYFSRRWPGIRLLLIIVLLLVAGFAAAQWRAALKASP